MIKNQHRDKQSGEAIESGKERLESEKKITRHHKFGNSHETGRVTSETKKNELITTRKMNNLLKIYVKLSILFGEVKGQSDRIARKKNERINYTAAKRNRKIKKTISPAITGRDSYAANNTQYYINISYIRFAKAI